MPHSYAFPDMSSDDPKPLQTRYLAAEQTRHLKKNWDGWKEWKSPLLGVRGLFRKERTGHFVATPGFPSGSDFSATRVTDFSVAVMGPTAIMNLMRRGRC